MNVGDEVELTSAGLATWTSWGAAPPVPPITVKKVNGSGAVLVHDSAGSGALVDLGDMRPAAKTFKAPTEIKVGDWVEFTEDAAQLLSTKPGEAFKVTRVGGFVYVDNNRGDEWNMDPDEVRLVGRLSSPPASEAEAPACSCASLLSGCLCGAGAAEIAATTGRGKNPVTGLWESRLA